MKVKTKTKRRIKKKYEVKKCTKENRKQITFNIKKVMKKLNDDRQSKISNSGYYCLISMLNDLTETAIW